MPESGQRVVVNATPIIALSLIRQLDLLQRLYGEILMPPAVRSEILEGGKRAIGITEMQAVSWLRVSPLQDPQ